MATQGFWSQVPRGSAWKPASGEVQINFFNVAKSFENEASHGYPQKAAERFRHSLEGSDAPYRTVKQYLSFFHCRFVKQEENDQESHLPAQASADHTHTHPPHTTMTEMKTSSIKIQRGLPGPASWSYGWQVLSVGLEKSLFPSCTHRGILCRHGVGNCWLGSEACQHIQEVKPEEAGFQTASCT